MFLAGPLLEYPDGALHDHIAAMHESHIANTAKKSQQLKG